MLVDFSFFMAIVYLMSFFSDAGISPEANDIEDMLETEIDLRPPSMWNNQFFLTVRQEAFNTVITHHEDGNIEHSIGNWELWVRHYWYEIREPNTECPQLPFGLAAACDWALLSPCLFTGPEILNYKQPTFKPPKTIFVHTFMISHFVESTLRFLNKILPTDHRFVVVIGGADQSTPLSNLDARWGAQRGFGGNDGGNYWNDLMSNPCVAHVFVENLDLANNPKVSPLPTGLATNFFNSEEERMDLPEQTTPILDRPLQVMVADRLRNGPQWVLRYNVYNWCMAVPDWCRLPLDAGNITTHKDYLTEMSSHSFIACPHGGGIDPSPKAWEAILVGIIPIMEKSYIEDAYNKLPVVFIDSWEEFFTSAETPKLLDEWRKSLAPYYEEGSELRTKSLQRLTTEYWVDVIEKPLTDAN